MIISNSFKVILFFALVVPSAQASDVLITKSNVEKKFSSEETQSSSNKSSSSDLVSQKPPTDQEIAKTAVRLCLPGASQKKYDEAYKNAMTLLKVESELKIPEEMKGMSLAAACRESGFDANAEGDHKLSKDGKSPMAIGILQMWPFYDRAYRVNRRNVESAARGWLSHIKAQVGPVSRNCKTTAIRDTWKVAWITGVRSPKKGGRCKESLSHWNMFQKIRDEVEKSNKFPGET